MIMRNNRYIFIILCAASLAFINTAGRAETHSSWGRTTASVIEELSRANTGYEEINLLKNPGYRNRVIDFIVKVDSGLREKITVIRARTDPEKDYLFLSGRLFSVRERYGALSQERFEATVKDLRSEFGEPELGREKNVSVRSYTGRGTKAIMRSRTTAGGIECSVYYYDSRLFRIIFTQ